MIPELHVVDWRRRVQRLYATVRELSVDDPAEAHEYWVASRDDLFAEHPASPLLPEERSTFLGLPVAPYDPAMRFELPLLPSPGADPHPGRLDVPTGTDGVVPFERVGRLELPGLGSLDVWALRSYGGGLFVPIKDPSGRTYGGGRYLLDTIKGADLGLGRGAEGPDGGTPLVVDLNFAYNPSCAYDPAWACPLAPAGNVLEAPLSCGELMR